MFFVVVYESKIIPEASLTFKARNKRDLLCNELQIKGNENEAQP